MACFGKCNTYIGAPNVQTTDFYETVFLAVACLPSTHPFHHHHSTNNSVIETSAPD